MDPSIRRTASPSQPSRDGRSSPAPVAPARRPGVQGPLLALDDHQLRSLACLGLRHALPHEVVPAPLPPLGEAEDSEGQPEQVARLARLDRASFRRASGLRGAFREERLRWRVEGLAGPFAPGPMGGRIVLN